MISETTSYRYDEQKQSDNNNGVIHVYRKNDNAWVGFVRYVKKPKAGKPFVKFYASDIQGALHKGFKEELQEYMKCLSKEWKEKEGIGVRIKENLNVKMNLEIDKGDGKPPKKIIV